MAIFYKAAPKHKTLKSFIGTCSDLDLHGRGVVKAQDKTWFVANLLPGEEAQLQPENVKAQSGTARVLKLLKVSTLRRPSDCPHAARCGGCSLQHLPPQEALRSKLEGICRLFKKNCSLDLGTPNFVEHGNELGYRRACRLAVRFNHGQVELGFRGKFSHEIEAIDSCKVLTPRLNALLPKLGSVLNALKLKRRLGHVELIDSDGAVGLLIRFTAIMPHEDENLLKAFGEDEQLVIAVQEPTAAALAKIKQETQQAVKRMPASRRRKDTLSIASNTLTTDEVAALLGMEQAETTERIITSNASELYLQNGNCRLNFLPSAFVQVNRQMNERMLAQVKAAVEPYMHTHATVLDLFCGLGNFSFALASQGAKVVGVDVVKSMIERAQSNAQVAGLTAMKFVTANLEEEFEQQAWAKQSYAVAILDPGRAGAKRATCFLSKLKPELIVMISCNPLAASRDSVELLQAGYKLQSWGVVDMFPRTAHIELMLVFKK